MIPFVNYAAAANSRDHDCDSMALALLTYGDDKENIYGIDRAMPITSLLHPLKWSPNMSNFAGKPKLVFVQVRTTV
jgi:hypothetical protein